MDPGLIAQAAALLRAGKLVAFPTETVYGLGANALDPAAVDAIFAAKRRPATSPLIVHVPDAGMARSLTTVWPPSADALAARFWPGPLTLVLPKIASIPDRVTAGLPNVGLRVPNHPVALALLRAAQLPIAAPSANLFTHLSPTTAEHVRQSLGSAVSLVLDGGPSSIGLESTVLSLAGERPVLLRPGMVSQAALEEILGPIEVQTSAGSHAHASPGLHPRHYSPRTPLLLVPSAQLPTTGRGVFLYLTEPSPAVPSEPMPPSPDLYAASLYATLHSLDLQHLDWIAVEPPPASPAWLPILDRLTRAAHGG
jgi:L-threonylcarbamoyladenylate synthase